MNNNHHISWDEIFPRVSKHTANEDHLKTCEQCSELVNILKLAREISHSLKPDNEWVHPSTLQLSETITKIYENSISGQEAANFINHVESCSLCFNFVAMTVEESLSPVPERVLEELKAYSDISLAEMVLKESPPEPTIFQKILSRIKKSLDKIKEGGFVPIPEPRPVPGSIKGPWVRKLENILVPQLVYALGLLIAVGGGGFGGYRYYVTTHRINQARELLVENHRHYMADTPRLSGGYRSTGIGMLMDEDAPPSFLTQAFDLTEQAIENGSKSVEAKQLQAQIFIIQKEYNKADSVFNLIADRDRHLAAVLNDLGVLKYKKEEWQEATEYFEATIQVNSDFTEAYYNLALAQNKLGKKQEAISTLDEYLKFKNDIEWKNAALSFLNKLREEISKNKI